MATDAAPEVASAAAADTSKAAATAAEAEAPAEEGDSSNANRNQKKKLRQRYLDILRLEAQAAAGPPLNAAQQAKLGRKEAVAAQLAALGCAPPELPQAAAAAPPTGRGFFAAAAAAGAVGLPGGALGDDSGITEEEVTAAMEALALGHRPPLPPEAASRPASPALQHQLRLQAANPDYDYFLTLPEPLPDLGVRLTDMLGELFFKLMAGRAAAGQPRAVKMMFDQLKVSAAQYGMPEMQLRVQLAVEYGIDPVTEQAVSGSDEDILAWVESQMAPAELRQARKAFERMVEGLLMQEMGGMPRGGGGRPGGSGRRSGRRR